MASLAKPQRLIKILPAEIVLRAMAEHILVNQGIALNRLTNIKATFDFDRKASIFNSCRVEVLIE